jgi:hypothetical protein
MGMGEGIFRCKEHKSFLYPRPLAGEGRVRVISTPAQRRIFNGNHEGHEGWDILIICFVFFVFFVV